MSTPKIQVLGLQAESEYDYIITKLEDFTTEKLATMSGRVLVKNLVLELEGQTITIPDTVMHIKFINTRYTAYGARIAGNGSIIDGLNDGLELKYEVHQFLTLSGFKSVENCRGCLYLQDCSKVTNSTIVSALNCNNISDVTIWVDAIMQSGSGIKFDNCHVIDNVLFTDVDYHDPSEDMVEFRNCSHIKNVRTSTTFGAPISYVNCSWVDGDTCDGYYTEEDNGKVQTVNTDGSKSLISVYDKEEIDSKFGDIGSILSALHEGGIT